jgi:FKBP-type peptidyl-prolyl cis-trans isomerase
LEQAFFMEKRMRNIIFPLLLMLFFSACESITLEDPAQYPNLKITDIKIGNGAQPTFGSIVTVHYVGTLTNGQKFDSSRDRNQPFSFRIGTSEVIKGWDVGLSTMKVGGKRKLEIPPEMGYGARSVGSIPANSTLIFEVELLNVQ